MTSGRPQSRLVPAEHRHGPLALVGGALLTLAVVALGIAFAPWGGSAQLLSSVRGIAVIAAVVMGLVGALALLFGMVLRSNQLLISELARHVSAGLEMSVLGAVPPAQALDVVLTNVYGRSAHNQAVITSLLGGEGRQLDRSDLTISEHTEVDYTLQRIDEDNYQLIMQVSYAFKRRKPVDTFVIFATSDDVLRDSIVLGCRQPLFELWHVPDDDPIHPLFHESVDEMLPSVRVGLSYSDVAGRTHEIVDRKPHIIEVRVGRWPEYLAFFREPLGGMPRLRPDDFMGSLRVFEISLTDIIGSDVEVESIQRLSLRSMTIQQVNEGYCYWQPPYPCFLEHMQVDAAAMSLDGDNEFLFRLHPFAFRSKASPARWAPAHELTKLTVQSWLLPGHGVALLWKRVTDDGTAAS